MFKITKSSEHLSFRFSGKGLAVVTVLSLMLVGCGASSTDAELTADQSASAGVATAAESVPSGDAAVNHDAMHPETMDPDARDSAATDSDATDHASMGHAEGDEAVVFESVAVRFAEEAFGDNAGDYGLTFAPDGQAVFFTRAIPTANSEAIYVARLVAGQWSKPEVAPFSGRFHDKEPYVSPDGSRVYFASRRPVAGVAERPDFDIWYAERRGDGWGDPVRVDAVSSTYDDDYPAVASDGTLVFARNDDADNVDLWVATRSPRGFAEPQALERPIKTVYAEADPWIAPDGRLIIFSSPKISSESRGQGDLYIIHRRGDGWTVPVSLGPHVNSIAHEYGPALSPDGTTFYFSRGFGGHVWMVPASILEVLDPPETP